MLPKSTSFNNSAGFYFDTNIFYVIMYVVM